ncbi:hypothetical protein CLOSTMETH_02099 [[Clostridium] methylpentosum DSM 5476]|uniref:Uncharacterized protein n=1 Tax=[Clostridium] methylpentosum DSM 5476 TaxID=537013 RepID=C0EE20_9FIRM|nr:hypothetical protein CLOSTMETH_02099 [[Clostridium] methylpentosum DSM 5476]
MYTLLSSIVSHKRTKRNSILRKNFTDMHTGVQVVFPSGCGVENRMEE